MKTVLAFGFVLLGITAVFSRECNMKPNEQPINWERLAGKTWFQVFNTDDAVNIATPCYVIQFSSEPNAHGKFVFRMLDTSVSLMDNAESEFIQEGDYYRMNQRYEEKWMQTSEKEAAAKTPDLVDPDVEEIKDHFSLPIALYTDYDSYFIGAMCNSDVHYVFAYVANPDFRLVDLVKIFNNLVLHGNAVPLSLSGCPDIKDLAQLM